MLPKTHSQVSKLVTILEASHAFMHKHQETEFIKEPIYTHGDSAVAATCNLLFTQNLHRQIYEKPNTKKRHKEISDTCHCCHLKPRTALSR